MQIKNIAQFKNEAILNFCNIIIELAVNVSPIILDREEDEKYLIEASDVFFGLVDLINTLSIEASKRKMITPEAYCGNRFSYEKLRIVRMLRKEIEEKFDED